MRCGQSVRFSNSRLCHNNHSIFPLPHTGVTDSKAVKGSSKSMLDWSSYSETAGSPSHILVIVSGIAAGLVLTVLLVCLFVTCRRKVSLLWIFQSWQTMFLKRFFFSFRLATCVLRIGEIQAVTVEVVVVETGTEVGMAMEPRQVHQWKESCPPTLLQEQMGLPVRPRTMAMRSSPNLLHSLRVK